MNPKKHPSHRHATVLRAALWLPRDIGELLRRHGTAGGRGVLLASRMAPPRQSELPGFSAWLMGQHG